ncbi:MAG: purine-nucleoside phosphorylase [Clostridia bacterium]|jgi:purine-nucleoside phosphorylase|nr:purine-nucleoside phosphorylase [Clostridia bacterium]
MEQERIIENAVAALKAVGGDRARIGLILGSGLGGYAETLENKRTVDYASIEGFPVSGVVGHSSRFVVGEKTGKTVIVMQGRFHYYEGYPQSMLALGVRTMKRLGVESLLITNAAGGVNFPAGTLMLISDHINLSGSNPLIGKNLDAFGPRFPDLSNVYDRALRSRLKALAEADGIPLAEGVYLMMSGPCYETPAEIRMARALGADAVGMSTVPEAIAAAHCGMRVVGISLITNAAAGILDQPLSHAEVTEAADRASAQFTRLVDRIVSDLF